MKRTLVFGASARAETARRTRAVSVRAVRVMGLPLVAGELRAGRPQPRLCHEARVSLWGAILVLFVSPQRDLTLWQSLLQFPGTVERHVRVAQFEQREVRQTAKAFQPRVRHLGV